MSRRISNLTSLFGLLGTLSTLLVSGAQRATAEEFVPILPTPAPGILRIPDSPLPSTTVSGFVGSQSCASSSCHGDPEKSTLLRSAYTIFSENDPHERAGSVLFNERSVAMAARLGLPQPAWKSKECLVCHAPGADAARTEVEFRNRVADGVSCEACHGPARDWLEPHRSYVWSDPSIWPADRKAEAGFRVTKSLPVRANLCADCHIGSENGQVTHDLIAAGHPRLLYEFSANQAMMPAHWNRQEDRNRFQAENPGHGLSYEATSWLIGQFLASDRELQLLANSARNPSSAWPELSQFDCFACHHDLKASGLKSVVSGVNPSAGKLQWGTWNLGLLRTAPNALLTSDAASFQATQAELQKLLQTFSGDREAIDRLASQQRQLLGRELQQPAAVLVKNRSVEQLRNDVLENHSLVSTQGWDSLTQYYLALVALEQGVDEVRGIRGISNPELIAILQEIRGQLAYQNGSEKKPAVTFDSPRHFDVGTKATLNDLFGYYQIKSASAAGR